MSELVAKYELFEIILKSDGQRTINLKYNKTETITDYIGYVNKSSSLQYIKFDVILQDNILELQ